MLCQVEIYWDQPGGILLPGYPHHPCTFGDSVFLPINKNKCSIAEGNNHAQLNTSTCDPSGASVPSSV